jgi:hypothetical protein
MWAPDVAKVTWLPVTVAPAIRVPAKVLPPTMSLAVPSLNEYYLAKQKLEGEVNIANEIKFQNY